MRGSCFIAACSSVIAGAIPYQSMARATPAPGAAAGAAPVEGSLAMLTPPPSLPHHVVPESLVIEDQYFDLSVWGFRRYLEAQRTTDPQLYAALDPQLAHLEGRMHAAFGVLAMGTVAGLASLGFVLVGGKTCSAPQATDPDFTAKVSAWNACADSNMRTETTVALVGVGAFVLGGLGWLILMPKRSDVLDLVNAHNRIHPEPLRLQVGYDPASRLALWGLSTTFSAL